MLFKFMLNGNQNVSDAVVKCGRGGGGREKAFGELYS